MTDEKMKDMTKMAVRVAKEGGGIYFDPNLRPPLWGSLEKAKEKITYGISQCHILKRVYEKLCRIGRRYWHWQRKGSDKKMREIEISLNSIDKVKKFVSVTTKFDAEIDLVSGRYIIDAKSIMGIFSTDLSKPIRLRIHDGRENVNDIIDALSEYVKK